jgi:hypothetical protein
MLDEFIAMLRGTIAGQGLAAFRPTLLLVDRQQLLVHPAAGGDADQEGEAYDWIAGHVRGFEDYLVAFRVDDAHFKVYGRIAGTDVERLARAVES